jgi:putative transposase
MPKQRNHYSSQFTFQVALEAARGMKTLNQLASEHSLHPNVISQWKRQLRDQGPEIFSHSPAGQHQQLQTREAALCEPIGRLKMELEWLKKKLPPSVEVKRAMIEMEN